MSKIKNPSLFSQFFKVDPKALFKLGVLDPTMNLDTPLFIDPILLEISKHAEMRAASVRYKDHFEKILDLLAASTVPDDAPWRSASRLVVYPEIKGTCLGYGAASVSGSAFGEKLSGTLILTAKEIIDVGIKNPKLFPSLMLFEDNVGPDRISDLTTNIILPDLLAFNARILKKLGVPVQTFKFRGGYTADLPANPNFENPTPIILVPLDILREVPTAGDWSEIVEAMQHNIEVRDKFNAHLGEIWKESIGRKKADVREELFRTPEAFKAFAAAIELLKGEAYDVEGDPHGLVSWHKFILRAVEDVPFPITKPKKMTQAEAINIVRALIQHFKHLVEDCGIWKEFWSGAKRRPEKAYQRLFFVMADAYCRANDLDLTPEAESGAGPVDFKISKGMSKRILVELKLSSNSQLISGMTKQLGIYADSEEPVQSFYVVADVGKLDGKDEKLLDALNNWKVKNGSKCEVEFIDATKKASASKRK